MGRLRWRPGERLRAEDGFALPTVLLGTVAAIGLSTAMVVSSLGATSGVTRDADTKAAFGVAEAGVSNALFRYNRFDTAALPCLNEGPGGQVVLEPAEASGWCRPVTASAAGGSYSYSVKPYAGGTPADGDEMLIVSTGYHDGLSRRVRVAAEYTTQPGNGGIPPFEDYQVLGKDGITIENGSTITADIGSQGPLTINNGGKLHCEKGQAAPPPDDAPCAFTEPDFELPPVDSSLVETTNDNAVLGAPGCFGWDPTTKRLTISQNKCSLTVGAAGTTTDLYLCKLEIGGSGALTVAPGANVNIWFAPPEQCGGEVEPFVGGNGSKVQAPGNPPSTLAFLVSDSPTRTQMTLSSGGNGVWPDCSDNFIIYAPTTDVRTTTAAHVCGGIAANTLTTGPGSTITKTSLSTVWELPGTTGGDVPHFVVSGFVECGPAASSSTTPDSGC